MQLTADTKAKLCKMVYSKPVKKHFDKGELVLQFTTSAQYSEGRTKSLSEMTELEAQALKLFLIPIITSEANAKALAMDTKRKKIIGICRSIGWEVVKDGKLAADMPRINNWVTINFKNDLNNLDTAQLSKVITAADNMKASTQKAIINATANQ